MKSHLLRAATVALLGCTGMAHADLGVSVTVGEPGFYGRIDIGDFPRPRLVFPEPVIVHVASVVQPPVYLHVPPGHAKNWSKHCGSYNACGQRVYFVDGGWYEDVYVPGWKQKHGKGGHGGGHGKPGGKGKGNGKGHGKG